MEGRRLLSAHCEGLSQSSLYWSRVGSETAFEAWGPEMVAILIVLEQGWKRPGGLFAFYTRRSQSSLYWSRVGSTRDIRAASARVSWSQSSLYWSRVGRISLYGLSSSYGSVAILIVLEQGWKCKFLTKNRLLSAVAILIVLEQGWKYWDVHIDTMSRFKSQSSLYWSRVGRF